MSPLQMLLNLSNVPRWVICPRYKEQSVAEHCFNVAVIADHIASQVDPEPYEFRYTVIAAALVHDMDEALTGDMPSSLKRGLAGEATPTAKVAAIVKVADLMEARRWWGLWGAGETPRYLEIAHSLRTRLNKVLEEVLPEIKEAALRIMKEELDAN